MEAIESIVKKLDEMFPDKNLLNIKEVVAYTGLSPNTVKSMFNMSRGTYIDKHVLANKLAK